MLFAVPCSGESRVVLVDADTGQVRGDIEVGDHPVHLARVDDRVFVATMGERSISVIVDGTVQRVELGVLGPAHFATLGDALLVPCSAADVLAVVDPDRLTLTERVPVGSEPHDVGVYDGHAYVGSRGDGTVSVVDPDGPTVVETHLIDPEARVQGIETGPDGVYAVDQSGSTVALIDREGIRTTATVGRDPYELEVSGSRVYVPGRDDGTVTVLDSTLTERAVHDVGGRPVDVLDAPGDVWVVDRERSGLRSLDGDAVRTPHPAISGTAHPEQEGRVLVSHYDAGAVSLVDLDTGVTRWTAETPDNPFEAIPI